MSARARGMLYDRVNAPDVTSASLYSAIKEAKLVGRLLDTDQAIMVANEMMAKLGAFASDPRGMISKEWDSPAATIESLSQAIMLAKRIGKLIEGSKYINAARERVKTWTLCQREPHEVLYEAINAPDVNFGSLTTAVMQAKRFGGLTDDDKYVATANAMLLKMEPQPVAFLTTQGKVEPWGGPLSFLFRSRSHHAERQPEPFGCDCPCTENDQVDRDFESIINFGR